MMRNVKALGLAFVAVVAMSAVAASAAQAVPGEGHITTSETKAVVTGEGTNHVLSVGGTNVTCAVAKLEGTVQDIGQDPTQLTFLESTVTPTYSNCQFGGFAATVQMNGCKYKLVGTAALTAQSQVVGCTSGKAITINAAGFCTITIGNQAVLPHVTYTNDSGAVPHHVQAHITVGGVAYTRDSVFCPQGEASFSGTTTIKAFKDLGTETVTEHGHQFLKNKCGEQLGILAT